MITRNHVIAAMIAMTSVGYISYLRSPSNDWMEPRAVNDVVTTGQPVRIDFKVRSRDNCVLTVTRYAERTMSNGTIVLLPPLVTETKVIKASPEVRSSFYVITFPPGTEPHRYRVFSRIRDDCSWLDRWWPRVTDTAAVEITVAP